MSSLDPSSVSGSLAINLIAAALFSSAVAGGEYLYSRLANRNPAYRRTRLGIFVTLWFLINLGTWSFDKLNWGFALATTFPLVIVVYRELNQFWSIGLVSADREVARGINYATSLTMCQHSFCFLGIGAAKLTADKEAFRAVIERCNRSRPVRLLLSPPNHGGLRKFAAMAGRDPNTYKLAVTESLRFIAQLKLKEAKNIQVRFYDEFPAFRLMFIDDSTCLMSYYIMGKGDGSNLPQLHIVKTPGAQDTQALYFGFMEYFEKIWNTSKSWNFKDHL